MYDHVHEQNNKVTKSRAGFSTLLNKEESSFLRKMENVLPEIPSHLDLLEGAGVKKKHKETMSSFAGQYIKDCNSVYRKISSNPFLETVPKRINTTVPMPAVVIASGADPCSTLGGIIPHFYRFFGILKFWGGYSGFADFSSFNDFENLGYIQVLTKMYLNN